MIKLNSLVELSNNSEITRLVEKFLNEKLNDEDKRIFNTWLKIIKNTYPSKTRRTFNLGNLYKNLT